MDAMDVMDVMDAMRIRRKSESFVDDPALAPHVVRDLTL
jgi:hypothetical protein